MIIEPSLTAYTKINSKWIKDLNIRPDTIKHLEENIGRILYDINHSKIFFDPPPGVMEIKTKINKWDLIKLKNTSQMVISKKSGEGVEKKEHSYTVHGNVNWCNHYGKQYGGSLKN